MWPNPQEAADLVTLTEEILNENFIFCAVKGTFQLKMTVKYPTLWIESLISGIFCFSFFVNFIFSPVSN